VLYVKLFATHAYTHTHTHTQLNPNVSFYLFIKHLSFRIFPIIDIKMAYTDSE